MTAQARPDVSVVIPTRNRARFLELALRSVLWQRDADLEVIVVDDASTDGDATAVAGIDDPRVRVLRNETPSGVSRSRNRGIEAARGHWVAFLDDDDLWAPTKLREQLAAARRDTRRWAFTGAVSVDRRLDVFDGEEAGRPADVVAALERYNAVPVGASNVLVHAELLAATGGFEPVLRHTADWDLWLRLARDGPPATVDRPLVAYRLHPASATMDLAFDPDELRREVAWIMANRGADADLPAVERWIGGSALRAGRRAAASLAYLRAARGGDIQSVARALVALVHPGAGKRLSYRPRLRRRVDDDAWTTEARSWLRDLQQ